MQKSLKKPTHLKDLTPDPENRRKHNPRNIGMVVDALHQVGAGRSIVIDEDNVVLAGNGVAEAAAEAGITKVQVVDVDGSTLVAVRRSGLTPEQKRALAIYDNRTAELAEWNAEQLQADLAAGLELKPWFSDEEQAILLGQKLCPKAGLTDPEAVPAPRATDIQKGDYFELGPHRILCGDSTQATDVARVTRGQTPELMATDPPYGIGYAYASHDDNASANAELVRTVFALAPAARFWTPGKMNLARELASYPDAKVLCWHKKFAAAGNGLGGASTWEPVLVVGVEHAHLPNDYLEHMTDREPGLRDKHPCPKPVSLWRELLEAFTGQDAVIYEPFSGSGTTLIACEQLGRSCWALDIEPAYVQVAIDRWQAFTGQKAVKVGEAVPA